MTITQEARDRVREALLDPSLHLGVGVGTMNGSRCTIATINLALTGVLTDGAHPCISPMIRHWVMSIQDVMPAQIRNSIAWREAAVGVAGSRATREVDDVRAAMLLEWMWDRLGDPAVLRTVTADNRLAWDRMLREKTAEAAEDAHYEVALAICSRHASQRAIRLVSVAQDLAENMIDSDGYWDRADCPGMLARLTAVTL